MIIEIPDACGQCPLTEKSSCGELWCKPKASCLTAIGVPPNDSCKVNHNDTRPDICPYNELINSYMSFH